jgi:uncharacterized membrane protein
MVKGPSSQESRQTKPVLLGLAVAAAAATVIGMLALWPSAEVEPPGARLGFTGESYDGEVVSSQDAPCQGQTETGVVCRRVRFEVLEGPDTSRMVVEDFAGAGGAVPTFEAGDRVKLAYDAAAERRFQYRYLDRDRGGLLVWLALAFGIAVVGLGRLRGLAALAGLVVSIAVLLRFVLPAILEGHSPVAVAVVGAAAIAFLALYLAHGFTIMTTVALLGTLASLALTVLLTILFVQLARLTGFASEEAIIVQVGASNVDLGGILLGGVIIGALGAIDDMTVTQASAVWELRAANPLMPNPSLRRAGLRIGRDHVASTVNTLALAYAGASMPVLLLLILSRQSLATVASGEVIATEIIRTLVGSIGLVAAVPITTWLSALVTTSADSEKGRHRSPRSVERAEVTEPRG